MDNYDKILKANRTIPKMHLMYSGFYSMFATNTQLYLYNPGEKLVVMDKPDVQIPVESTADDPNSKLIPVIGGNLITYGKIVRTKEVYRTNNEFPVNYMSMVYTQYAKFFSQYIRTGSFNVMMLDIETYTKGEFPVASKDPILSIGFAINSDEIHIIDCEANVFKASEVCDVDYDSLSNSITPKGEKRMIELFIDYMVQYNVDMLVTYNGLSFDLPYIIERALILKVSNLSSLFKFSNFENEDYLYNAFYKNKKYKRQTKLNVNYLGRLHYDIYEMSITADQSLDGKVKNRRMKTIAEYYKIDMFNDIDISNSADEYKNNRLRFNKYLVSDIHITRELFKLYWLSVKSIAESLGVGYDYILSGSKSSGVTYALLDAYVQKGWLPFNHPVNININNKFPGKYGGAIVGLKKVGMFAGLYKYDFNSFYPNILVSFNLGLENTTIVDIKPFSGEFKFYRGEWYNDIVIPDIGLNADVVIRIFNFLSPAVRVLIKYFNERKIFKKGMKLMKTYSEYMDKEEMVYFKSYQQGDKVIVNSMYGTAGIRRGMGNNAVAIAITGLARYLISQVSSQLKSSILEIDSVTYDTPIWVKKGDLIDIIPIRDLHNIPQVPSNSLRLKYEGEYKVLTREGWADIQYTKSHEVNKAIHRVETIHGLVDVTVDHSLFDNNTKEEITPKDLIVGESDIEVIPFKLKHDVSKVKMSISKARILGVLTGLLLSNKLNYDFSELVSVYLLTKYTNELKVPSEILSNRKLAEVYLSNLFINSEVENQKRILRVTSKTLYAGILYLVKLLNYDMRDITVIYEHKRIVNTRYADIYKVTYNEILSNNDVVYDISTATGTFITALGDICLHNTDGILTDRKYSEDELNKMIEEIVYNTGVAITNTLKVEEEKFALGFIPRMKNYILVDDNMNVTIHGAAFKSSKFTSLQYKLVQSFITDIIQNNEPFTKWKHDWDIRYKTMEIEDYIIQVTLAKNGWEYAKGTANYHLVEQYKRIYGDYPKKGTHMEYLYVKDKFDKSQIGVLYDIYEIEHNKYEINFERYYTLVTSIYEMFNLLVVDNTLNF